MQDPNDRPLLTPPESIDNWPTPAAQPVPPTPGRRHNRLSARRPTVSKNNLGLEFREVSFRDVRTSAEKKRHAVSAWLEARISGDELLKAAKETAELTHLATLPELESDDPMIVAQAESLRTVFEHANHRMAMALLAEMWLRSHRVAGDDLSLIRKAAHQAKLNEELGPILPLF